MTQRRQKLLLETRGMLARRLNREDQELEDAEFERRRQSNKLECKKARQAAEHLKRLNRIRRFPRRTSYMGWEYVGLFLGMLLGALGIIILMAAVPGITLYITGLYPCN